ncbi:hypothetical protein EZS27_023762 [termite gut metagenome]|uniref:N-acetyltransferase domain-containing protein n=1 Tax=termite gut metagenome TaxID=433724 RepID=A0A5J4QZD1_9ZZZZ
MKDANLLTLACVNSRFISHSKIEYWGSSIFLMEKNGKAFGRIYWHNDDSTTMYFAGLSVSVEARKQGLATELLEMYEDISKALGATMLCLAVQKNTWTHGWCKRRGYDEFEHNDVENEEDTIWMKKAVISNNNTLM